MLEVQSRRRAPRRTAVAIAAGVVVIVVCLVLGVTGSRPPLTAAKAAILGAVEGISEFLPISSTGHLLIAQRALGFRSGAARTAADTYAISIQIGAILAVVAVYRQRLRQLADGVIGRDPAGRQLLLRLAVAFLPAAVVGVAAGSSIKGRLFGPWPVIAAWFVGGVFLLRWRPQPGTTSLGMITNRSALVIGLAQTLALWPGVSRSLVTIVAALAIGCTMSAAIEFSFLLGLATLSAATVLDLAKDGSTLLHDYGWRTPLLGVIIAFLTALVAVRWFVAYLRTRPLTIFGWYRIAIAVVCAVLVATGAV